MKKILCILSLIMFSLSAMDEPPKTYSELKISDLCNVLSKTCPELKDKIGLRAAEKYWWYPVLRKDMIRSPSKNILQKIRFSPSGEKFVTFSHDGEIGLYNAEFEKLQTFWISAGLQIDSMMFNKEETKIFGFGESGVRFGCDIKHNKVMYFKRTYSRLSSNTQFSKNMTKVIIGDREKAILVDTDTGEQERVLWENFNDDLFQNAYCAGFSGETDCVDIFHNNNCFASNDCESEKIQIKPIVPKDAYWTMYSPEKNSIVYFSLDGSACVLDIATQQTRKIKDFNWRMAEVERTKIFKRDACLIDNGKKLIVSVTIKHNYFFNIYDLDSCSLIATSSVRGTFIGSFSQKNLLWLIFEDEEQLWDTDRNCLIARFQHSHFFAVLCMNGQHNKMMRLDNGCYLTMWNCYQPTWEQFLLKQRIIWWWKTARTAQNFNSPEEWLGDVAKRLGLKRWDLVAPWKSLAPEGCRLEVVKMPNGKKNLFSVLQASMWQTVQNRIKRSQQYKEYVPSQAK